MMLTFPRYTWDPILHRYRSRNTGRLISAAAVRRALEVALDNEARRSRDLADQLRKGEIGTRQFEVSMREVVKNTQVYSAAAGKGGWAQLTPADYGRVGQQVRNQYGFLTNLGAELRADLPRDGRFLQRTEQYARAGKPTYLAVREADAQDAGYDQERSLLHPAEHCETCVAEAEKGWQPIGTMVPVGQRDCHANDRCSVEFRNSVTGKVLPA